NDADHQISLLEPPGCVRFQDATEGFVAEYQARLAGRRPSVFALDNLYVSTANSNRDGLYEYRAIAGIRFLDLFPPGGAWLFRFDRDCSHPSNLTLGLLSDKL